MTRSRPLSPWRERSAGALSGAVSCCDRRSLPELADPAEEEAMKAIVQDSYGTADVLELEDMDRPVTGSGTCCSAFTRPAHSSGTGTS
jgi:hypothetical protein